MKKEYDNDIKHLEEALERLKSDDPIQREYGIEMVEDQISYLKEKRSKFKGG